MLNWEDAYMRSSLKYHSLWRQRNTWKAVAKRTRDACAFEASQRKCSGKGAVYWCEQYRLWRGKHEDLMERHLQLLDELQDAVLHYTARSDVPVDRPVAQRDGPQCIMCHEPLTQRQWFHSNVCNACWSCVRQEQGE